MEDDDGMTIEELEQRHYEIKSRAEVRRTQGDLESARMDEQTASNMAILINKKRAEAEQKTSS